MCTSKDNSLNDTVGYYVCRNVNDKWAHTTGHGKSLNWKWEVASLTSLSRALLPVHTGSDWGAAGHDPTHHQIPATAPLWPLSAAGKLPTMSARCHGVMWNTFTPLLEKKKGGMISQAKECQCLPMDLSPHVLYICVSYEFELQFFLFGRFLGLISYFEQAECVWVWEHWLQSCVW